MYPYGYPPRPRPPPSSNTKLILAIIAIVFILIIGSGIVYYMFKTPEPSTTGSNNNNPTTPSSSDTTPSDDTTSITNIQGDRYYFARQCPDYLTNKGQHGILLKNSDYGRNPFANGGAFNGSWTWTHPYVCYGTAKNEDLPNLYNFTNKRTGLHSGIIMKDEVVGGSPFVPGGTYGWGWTWTHPYLQTANNADGYYLNKEGILQSGLIINKNALGLSEFASGGSYTGDWHWRHPYVTK